MNRKLIRRRVAIAAAGILAASGGVVAAAPPAFAEAEPQQGIVVAPRVRVPEGTSSVFAVSLAAQPKGNVTVALSPKAGDDSISLKSPGSITFTPENWNKRVKVEVAAAADADATDGQRAIEVSGEGVAPVTVYAKEADSQAQENAYITEFSELYDKIKDPSSGYFSPEGVPYHSVETLLVEAPDHGHTTTSEAMSYYMWLEAYYGKITGNWEPFNTAWEITEEYIIPKDGMQPGAGTYDPSDPADYAPESDSVRDYPAPLDADIEVGQDPLAEELASAYGDDGIYGMHWLLDVDDVYGFGGGGSACGDDSERVTYINTYQRGSQESVWETVPHPSCDTGEYGSEDGFPPIFVDPGAANQWRFTNAPDADARAVQAGYWAYLWAEEQGNVSQISDSLAKTAKMGDYLRYAMYDKYFKELGCDNPNCPGASGKEGMTGLMAWYYAWGGDLGGEWAWRIGSSHNHGGYQNPLAAWALSTDGPSELRPESPSAGADWATGMQRQLQFAKWLQSAEGAIAGGATNSSGGSYGSRSLPEFFGMEYDEDPVWHDPPSNEWFGFQVWNMQRYAELYMVTGNAMAKSILDPWIEWAISETTVGTGGEYQVPSTMAWEGAPSGDFSGTGTPPANPNLHVEVTAHTTDVGVTASFARTLIAYAARDGAALSEEARETAKGLLDAMLEHKDDIGIAVEETRTDYSRFDETGENGLYIPDGYSGVMPNGDVIEPGATFIDIRSFNRDDPEWPKVQEYLDGGPAPTFTYHRFWAQADIAMALADYGMYFGE